MEVKKPRDSRDLALATTTAPLVELSAKVWLMVAATEYSSVMFKAEVVLNKAVEFVENAVVLVALVDGIAT